MPANESPLDPKKPGPLTPVDVAMRDEDATLLVEEQQTRVQQAHAPASSPIDSGPTTETIFPRQRQAPLPPQVEGFEILELLGMGSFGHVWKARDLSNGKVVAIKFFTHGADERWQTLLEEVQQHAQLDGVRGIIDLKKVVARANPPYYVMAFADQGSLAARLENGPLPLAESVALFTQSAEALAYVHAKGICHCDLKPGNILLDARGRALLADFGQAQLSSDGQAACGSPALGTFFYMAPEQADLASAVSDPRWDVYGLGAIFFAALTGSPPHYEEKLQDELTGRGDLTARLARYRNRIARAPVPTEHRRVSGIDSGLVNIIDRCLHTDPARRPADAGELLRLLRLRSRRHRQRPMLWVGLAASILALCITMLFGVRSKNVAIDAYQRDLTARQLEGDLTSASIVASVVQNQLRARLERVEATATKELYLATRRRNRGEMERFLALMMSNAGRPATTRFAETTITNANGELLAMVRMQVQPEAMLQRIDPRTLRRRYPHFSWRDWFSGQGDRFDEADRFHEPIHDTHISDPYVSSMEPDDLFISISVPIRDPADEKAKPIGVLEAAVRLQQMNRWLRQARIGQAGFVVLLDSRGHCVLHPSADHRPQFGKRPTPYLTPQEEKRLLTANRGTIENYRDPLMGREFMAGYEKMSDPRIGWVALVQHEREEMLAPISGLRQRLDWIGVQSFLIVSFLVGGLWGWLFWMLRRSEQLGEV